uniref:Uncharacterized protein n=1 Tax=mine drainage metagenome TaxID=410659 RepID=E6QNS4_9ZZZZ
MQGFFPYPHLCGVHTIFLRYLINRLFTTDRLKRNLRFLCTTKILTFRFTHVKTLHLRHHLKLLSDF